MVNKKTFPKVTRIVVVTDNRTGAQYEEKRVYQYDPDLKYSKQLSSKRTGRKKMPGSDEWVKTRPKKASKTSRGAANGTTASRSKETAMNILAWAAKVSGISRAVRSAFPAGGTADKILSVGEYLVMTGDTVNKIGAFQNEHELPYTDGLSEDGCYRLFKEVGNDEAGIQALFGGLTEIAGKESPVLALDSTTVSTYAESEGGIKPFARQGFNKDGDGLETFKLITLYSIDSKLPVSFELQPGNIPDVSSVVNCIRRAQSYGLKKPQFVLDNGFFSRDNVTNLCRSHVKFTMRVTLTDKWIYEPFTGNAKKGLEPLREKLKNPEATCPFDTMIAGTGATVMTPLSWTRLKSREDKATGDVEQQDFRLYYHYFLNREKHLLQTDNFNKNLFAIKAKLERREQLTDTEQSCADKFLASKVVRGGKVNVQLNSKAIEEQTRNYGVFCLVSNVDKDPWTALVNYRTRNLIENSYRVVKGDLDGKKARVWSMASERGKEVCRLIALGIRFFVADAFGRVKDKAYANSQDEHHYTKEQRGEYAALAKWIESETLDNLLLWFDCVETVTVKNACGKKRWTTESIRRDRLFLKMLYELH